MLVEHGTLVLVLDGARMALYHNAGEALNVDLKLISEKRQHIAETANLGSSPPGRSFASSGARRHSYEETDLHAQLEDRFIKECVERLEQLTTERGKLAILIAPPSALGVARSHYSSALRKSIVMEIDRDYATRSAEDISSLISGY